MNHYQDEVDRLVKIYTKAFEDHQLMEFSVIYYMHKRDTMVMDVWIAFFGKRICITGDAIIEGHGVVSNFGYGLMWFISELGPDYLAEKFLMQEWVEEAAKDFVEDELEELGNINCPDEKAENQDRIDALWDIKNSHAWNEYEFGEIWQGHHQDCEDWPPRRYDPRALAMLAAIQMKFRELYREM